MFDEVGTVSLAVEMNGISKRFGTVQALDSVCLRVKRQSIHALVGENGAGKTTLMRVLYGALQPDFGTVALDGKPCRFRNSSEAIRAGVGMVSQHYSIIPQINCLDNLMLGAEPGFVLSRSSAKRRADELAARMGFEFDWEADAATLSPSGAQKLEILKLLWREARVMILDEPTAMLSPSDSDALYASLKQLTEQGATIIVVTHRLPEVLENCQQVTVLRGGRNVVSADVKDTNGPMLAEWIVGQSMHGAPDRRPPASDEIVLEAIGLSAKGDRGNLALKSVGFKVRKGEILGIAGVDGSGQRELFRALLGLVKPVQGKLLYRGRNLIPATVADRLRQGFRIIVEDRHEEGVIDDWPLIENAALGLHWLPQMTRKTAVCARYAFMRFALAVRHGKQAKQLAVPYLRQTGWIDFAARRREAQRIADRFDTRHGGLHQPMSSLSGGNQQRFVAGRALSNDPQLILAFQPSRGLDISASQKLYQTIREECGKGASAIVVSFDLDELMENCDRIVAMCNGRMAEPPKDKARDRNAIGRLMVGADA